MKPVSDQNVYLTVSETDIHGQTSNNPKSSRMYEEYTIYMAYRKENER